MSYAQDNDLFETLFEKSNYRESPVYEEIIDFYKRLDEASEFATLKQFGTSPQGRPLYYLVVSSDKQFEPTPFDELRKPVVFVVNGIHPGEIAGSDASMLLLREYLIEKKHSEMLDNITLVIIPVFNVDGHARRSPYNRINQNGPDEMGWRTTAQNLNLNRDWLKADAPEMQQLLQLFNSYVPDVFIDTHTTDGADYQYTAQYAVETGWNTDSLLSEFSKNMYIPYLVDSVKKDGFLISPIFFTQNSEFLEGLYGWQASPRFSNGYGAAQNRLTLLIETHMLKPYNERVFCTKSMLHRTFDFTANYADTIRALNMETDKKTIDTYYINKKPFPLTFRISPKTNNFTMLGFAYEIDSSAVSGRRRVNFTNNPIEVTVPFYNNFLIEKSVYIPFGYLIPPEWEIIADRLSMHNIEMYQLPFEQEMYVSYYKFDNVSFYDTPYESHHRVKEFTYDIVYDSVTIMKGSWIIPCNQRNLRLIVNALEPDADDSFLKWGFFNAIFERKEYFEYYVMEHLAEKMIITDQKLADEFFTKLDLDKEFAQDPYQRLMFFYKRSPYFDQKLNVYPILRIEQTIE